LLSIVSSYRRPQEKLSLRSLVVFRAASPAPTEGEPFLKPTGKRFRRAVVFILVFRISLRSVTSLASLHTDQLRFSMELKIPSRIRRRPLIVPAACLVFHFFPTNPLRSLTLPSSFFLNAFEKDPVGKLIDALHHNPPPQPKKKKNHKNVKNPDQRMPLPLLILSHSSARLQCELLSNPFL